MRNRWRVLRKRTWGSGGEPWGWWMGGRAPSWGDRIWEWKWTEIECMDQWKLLITLLYCAALSFSALHYTALHYIAIQCGTNHCTLHHCTAIYFSALCEKVGHSPIFCLYVSFDSAFWNYTLKRAVTFWVYTKIHYQHFCLLHFLENEFFDMYFTIKVVPTSNSHI